MVSLAERDRVGAVGPLLLYPNGTVQHAGVVLGIRGTADHVMRGFPGAADGYAGSLSCTREVSAVTAACMLIRRDALRRARRVRRALRDPLPGRRPLPAPRALRPAHPLHAARRPPPPRERHARRATTTTSTARSSSTPGARRSPAATRTTARCSRSRGPTTDRGSRRERPLRQLPRLHEQQRDPHLQPRERAHRPRRRLRRRRARRPGHDRAARDAEVSGARLRRGEERRAPAFRTAGRRRSCTPGRRGSPCASSPRTLGSRYGCPYVVHLEDNEDVLTADSLGLTLEQLHTMSGGRARRRGPADARPSAPDAELPRRRGGDDRRSSTACSSSGPTASRRRWSGRRSSPSSSPPSRRSRSFAAGSGSPTARRCSCTPGTRTGRTLRSCEASTSQWQH